MDSRLRGKDLARGGEPRAETDGVFEGAGGSLALADDVEGGAVRGRRKNCLQAARHGDAAIEASQLRRDLALVVVHREDTVEFAAESLEEDGVRRIRPLAEDAAFLRPLDRRLDDLDLLEPAEPVLATVGIECAHRDARLLAAG